MKSMLGITLPEAQGPLIDLLKKLSGAESYFWLTALKKFLRKENPFAGPCMNLGSQQRRLEKLFEKYSIGGNIWEAAIPIHKTGFDRLIIVPHGLTVENLLPRLDISPQARELIDPRLYLTARDGRSNRNSSYAIWVRDMAEAEEFANIAALELDQDGVKGVTLLERLLFELIYQDETGDNLDKKYSTLCTGTHYEKNPDGVVVVTNNQGRLSLSTTRVSYTNPTSGVREVIA